MRLCYHCGSETRDPTVHDGLPYCGRCAVMFGYSTGGDS
jgi:hypothetical protein